jgi:hypothetical protein
MKKLFLLVVAIAITTIVSQAQEVRIGAKGGVNFATFSGDDLGDVKSRTGFHIGGLVEIPVSEKFAIQPEVLYSSQGSKYSDKGTELGVDYSYNVEQKLDYIQVPVMAKFYAIDGLSLEVGPQVSFLTSSKLDYEGTLGGVTVSGEEDLDDVSSIDFSIGAGASYRLPMGLFFTARYNFGLGNVNDAADADDRKIQNRVAQLSVGYSF